MTRIPIIAFIALIVAPTLAFAAAGEGAGNREALRNASGITSNDPDPRWNSDGNWQGGASHYNSYAGGCTSCGHMSVGGAGVY